MSTLSNPAVSLALGWVLGSALVAGVVVGIVDRWILARMTSRSRGRIFEDADRVPDGRLALVLGCPPRRRDGRPNRFLTDRIAAARRLFDAGRARGLRLSGIGAEAGPTADEVGAMHAALRSAGLPESAIELDPGARRTIDSIRGALRRVGDEQIVLVSQRFHLIRALVLADAAGLDATIGFAADGDGEAPRGREALREHLARWRTLLDALRLRAAR